METTWEYPSSSSEAIYTVTHAANGLLACTCRGWLFKRGAQPRKCKHIDDVIAKHHLAVEVRGDYVFSFGDAPPHDDEALTSGSDVAIINVVEDVTDMATATMTETATATMFLGMKASGMVEGRYGHLLDAKGKLIAEKFNATFGNGEWAMDEKLDGHRCQILKVGEDVTTTLRSVPLPAHIIEAMRQLPFDAHLDGELAIPGGVSTDVPNLALRDQLQFLVFDVVNVCGESTLHLPYTERRALLETLAVHFTGPKVAVAVVAQYEPTLANIQTIWDRGGEGVILKRKSSIYRPGYRSADWLKVKRLEHHTVTITGFLPGSLGPTAITLFKFDDGVVGRCKTLNQEELAATAANPESYVGRRLVIECQQRTRSGGGRHMMWDHFAGDGE